MVSAPRHQIARGKKLEISLSLKSDYPDQIKIGRVRERLSRNYEVLRIYVEVEHIGLKASKEISGADEIAVQQRFNQLVAEWDKKYAALLEKEQRSMDKASAEKMDLEAKNVIASFDNLLQQTLSVDDAVDWAALQTHEHYVRKVYNDGMPFKGIETFKEAEPEAVSEFLKPVYLETKPTFFQSLFGQRKRLQNEAQAAYRKQQQRYNEKLNEYEEALAEWSSRKTAWDTQQHLLASEFEINKAQHEWEQDEAEAEFERKKAVHNQQVADLEQKWQSGDPEAVIEHACIVLDSSVYPDWVQVDYLVQYQPETKLMKMEYTLPPVTAVKVPKSIRLVATTGELKETLLSTADQKKYYDSICYQIALRTVHELFEADKVENISAIAFNGISEFIDPATGLDSQSTIMSAVFDRQDFLKIDLGRVDAKACFKSFKGVAASSLIGLSAIPPVVEMDRDDSRFVEQRDTTADEVAGTNLATMDWEDFEHLVREVFEKEFSSRGGEVKVTQSSSDGGVDAIAFDPDPISGGKIVIQAKRYTRTVGVSAVRDLYGTTMNEGASKGILVTTADFGPDAYKFVSDKPLTLLNGNNLLYLLEKHGTKATIDLLQARKELGLAR